MTELFLKVPEDLSFLFLGTRWPFDKSGFSTINKSLIGNLLQVSPKVKITCTVLQDDDEIKEDLKDTGVELKGAKRPRGSRKGKKPTLRWLDESIGKYYIHLVQDNNYDFIIGHAPQMANGCLNLKDLCRNKTKYPNTVLMFHGVPKDEHGFTDEDMLMDWLKEADIVVSLGKMVENELLRYISAIEPKKRPIHNMYIPSCPLEFLDIKQNCIEDNSYSTQKVCVMSRDTKDLNLNNLNFSLAVTATAKVSRHFKKVGGKRIKLCVFIADDEEEDDWKRSFKEVIDTNNLKGAGLSFKAIPVQTIEPMITHKSNLFLLPLKHDSTLFGTEALAAVAAEVPILISRDTGLASLLESIKENEPVVYGNQLQSIAEIWSERIIDKLERPDDARRIAGRLRERLLQQNYLIANLGGRIVPSKRSTMAHTHLEFIRTIKGTLD